MLHEARYEPADCHDGCADQHCPYTHLGAWFVDDDWFGDDEMEAKAEAARRNSAASLSATGTN